MAAVQGAIDTDRNLFIKNLVEKHGIKEKQLWQNNNGTVSHQAYIIDVKNLNQVDDIISKIWNFNKNNPKQPPLVAVPVAGWAAPAPNAISILTDKGKKEALVHEYAKSFSLSPFTTGKNADVILRTSQEAQKVLVFENDKGERFITITSGCRITDIEQELAKRKLALRPHMTTLHVASWVGAASNGCYGPGKDYMSMTTDIVEMKVVTPTGKLLTLSAKENPQLFSVMRDCHLGAAFAVKELTIKGIEPDFLMKRTDLLLKDVTRFKDAMMFKDLLNKQHFIMHYIPVGMCNTEDHFPRFRISTFERTLEAPTEATKSLTQEQQDNTDWENLVQTSLGEPLINGIVGSKDLQKYFDIVLELAARKTFGDKPEKVEIGPSAQTIHLLKTYTESPITDINWLIQVADVKTAQDLLVKLMSMIEEKLKIYAKDDKYPLLTIYARFLKGIYYPTGEGGIAPTAVDKEDESILSFELLSYPELQKTEAFKEIQNAVIKLLQDNQFKFKYHPGKTWPDNLTSLTQIFTDTIDKQKLANFQDAVIKLHEGKENISRSPFLTSQKKYFIGLGTEGAPTAEVRKLEEIGAPQKNATIEKIAEVAKQLNHPCLKSAQKMAKSVKAA